MRAEDLAFLAQNCEKTSLDLSSRKFDDYDVEELSNALKGYPDLEELDLSDNFFSSKGLLKIIPSLRVRNLKLNYLPITPAAIDELNKNKFIRELELDDCQIGDEEAHLLAKNKRITWLSLGRNKITDLSMDAFGENLTLKTLIILNNPISSEGLKKLIKNSTISTLLIKNQHLNTEDIKTVNNQLFKNRQEKKNAVHNSFAFSQCIKSKESVWSKLPIAIVQKILFFTLPAGPTSKKNLRAYLILKSVQEKKWYTFATPDEQKTQKNIIVAMYDEKKLQEEDIQENIILFRNSHF